MKVESLKTIEVADFKEFLDEFDLYSDKVAGDDGTDEELIKEVLEDVSGKWLVTFVDDGRDGFFRLFLISEDSEDVHKWIGAVIEEKGVNILIGVNNDGVMQSLEWCDRNHSTPSWTEDKIYGRTVNGSDRVFDDNNKLIFGL